MDDELEQFILEKSPSLPDQLSQSSRNNSPVEKMNPTSPQSPVQCSQVTGVQTGTFNTVQPSLLESSPGIQVPCSSPAESLPSISQFSCITPTSYPNVYSQQNPTKPSHMSIMENHISESNLLDLNGNIHDKYTTAPADFHHDQEFEGHYQSALPQGEYCSYNMNGYYSEGINVSYYMQSSSPESVHEYSYCHGVYGTQASFDSEDSFEVECMEQEMSNSIQKTAQIGQFLRNAQHNSGHEDRCPLPNFAVFTECKKVPNRRGRPVTYNKPGYHYSDSDSIHSDEDERMTQSKGCRRGAKNILLWKFLLGELRKPNSNHIKWENEREGIFKFVDTAECSRLWGQMKKKDDMNFEKLSRGIRHYYKDGLMSRRDGIRLVYKFNWDRVPRAYWPRIR